MVANELIHGNLPSLSAPLVGRAMEVKAASALLLRDDKRILTLTGTGGIGKTSLALQIATEMQPFFPDGVFFVSLAPISEPDQVIPAITRVLEIQETADEPLQEQLHDYLRDRQTLLLLDNFEQIVEAAPLLNELLATAPDLRLLVTSRVRLQLDDEQVFSVSSLALPDLAHLPAHSELATVASIDLFLQRARLVQPGFELTKANALTVATICARLDGLPLAVELAAARIKLLPPQALLKRLENSLSVLTSNADEHISRHQTLRNTIQWSYDLLTIAEQQLFRTLAIFIDGFTLHAVEALYQQLYGASESVLDDLSSLLEKHLIRAPEQDEEDPRFHMLETIRAFGLELLETSDEYETVKHAYMQYFLDLAEEADKHITGQQGSDWKQRLEDDLANLRSVMQASLTYGKQVQNWEIALRMGSALKSFWTACGYFREGRTFLEEVLRECKGAMDAVQIKAFLAAVHFALLACDYEQAQALLETCRAYYHERNDLAQLPMITWNLGWTAHLQYHYAQAHLFYDEALALGKQLHDENIVDIVRRHLAYLVCSEGDYQQARVLMEECVAYRKRIGDSSSVATALASLAQFLRAASIYPPVDEMQRLLDESLIYARETEDNNIIMALRNGLAWVMFLRGNLDEAYQLVNETIAFFKEVGRLQSLGHYLELLARIYAAQGKPTEARVTFEESVVQARKQKDIETMSSVLVALAHLAVEQNQYARATRLLGAEEKLREQACLPVIPFDSLHRDHALTIANAILGRENFELLRQEGRALSPTEALVAGDSLPANRTGKHISYPAGLSRREIDVLSLVAQGLTDAQVAEQLVISTRTVTTHLTSIYNKLQVGSRAAATNFAVRNHLV